MILAIHLLLLVTLVTNSSAQTWAVSNESLQRTPGVRVLELGKVIDRDIALGDRHLYRIVLYPEQSLRVTVKEHGWIDVLLTLRDPRGQKLIAVGGPNGFPFDTPLSVKGVLGMETISFVAARGGTYQLEVSAKNSTVSAGSYQITINTQGVATERHRVRTVAERLFAEAELLRIEKNEQALQRNAIGRYEQALFYWRKLHDAAGEAETLNSLGVVHFNLLDKEKARSYMEQAVLLWRAAGDPQGEATSLNNIGHVHPSREKAVDYHSQALQLWSTIDNRRGEALTLFYLAGAYSLHNKEKTLVCFERALAIWRELKDGVAEAHTLIYQAQFYGWLGKTQKSRELYERVVQRYRSLGFKTQQVASLLRIGETYFEDGEYQKALDYYDQALQLSRGTGQEAEAYALYNIGVAYFALGEKQQALNYLSQALPLWGFNQNGEAYTFENVGRIYASLGDPQRALDFYNRALPLMRNSGDRHGEIRILNDLGQAHWMRGNAKWAIEHYNEALLLSRAVVNRNAEAHTLSNLAKVHELAGETPKALLYYNQALNMFRAVSNRGGQANARYDIARVDRARGKLSEARTNLEEALSIVESLRIKISSEELRSSYFASVQKYYELYLDLLMQQHKQRPSEGLEALAFQTNERARARTLLELLAEARIDIRQGVDAQLLERERTLKQLLQTKADRQTRLLSGSHTGEQARVAAQEIEVTASEYQSVQARIRLTSPRYSSLTQSAPLGLKEIQEQVIDSSTLLLEYALGDERSYLWAVSTDSIISYELPKRAEIETTARRLYDLLTVRNRRRSEETNQQWLARLSHAEAEYTETAARLSQMLLGPASALLESKRLVVVSDGALQYLPFAALPDPRTFNNGDDGGQPLIVKHEIVNLPSASVLGLLRRETLGRKTAPRTLAVLADPVFDQDDPRVKGGTRQTLKKKTYPDLERAVSDVGLHSDRGTLSRLPFTREEAEVILAAVTKGDGMKVVDFDANVTFAKSAELSEYRIVHFATHGLLNTEHPMLSGLVLSLVNHQGQPQDGFLRMHEIYNLNLPAELVVLSACQTGLGKEVRGEGLLGLTRGFMYAGSKRVLASFWKVNDEATSELMKRFYREMLVNGKSPATALRASQIEMWQQDRWRSPYFWSAFVLQGEYR